MRCGVSHHEKESTAARYNGAQRGAVSEKASGDLTKHDGDDDERFRESIVLVKNTPEADVRPTTTSLFGVVPETPGMSCTASLDSAYESRPFGPDASFVKEPRNETSELKVTGEKFCHDSDEVYKTLRSCERLHWHERVVP